MNYEAGLMPFGTMMWAQLWPGVVVLQNATTGIAQVHNYHYME